MDYLIVSLYSLSLLLVFLFSLGQLHLTFNYLRARKLSKGPGIMPDQSEKPVVTVQLPIFNEKYVVERLIDAITRLEYPQNKLEIQVLDDSTDETSDLIENKVQYYRARGFDIKRIYRKDRTGFKAGALQVGLETAKGEFLAVFDADFLPDPSFLVKTVPYFVDQEIGMVQTRWGHVNSNYSLLTRLQAFGLDAHFTVEQTGRSFAGSFINFNGTAGIWRKNCITNAGGWSADTLTEDLDLSYRAQMNGWKFKYLEDVVSPAELPVIMPAIKTQQYRWNKGAAETAVKNLGKVLRMPISKTAKIHAALHLLNSAVFIPLLLAAILSIPMLYIKHNHVELKVLFNIGSVFLVGFFSISFYYWIASRQIMKEKSRGYFITYFPMFLAVSMGLSLHNTIAVIEGLAGFKTPFVRTPKFNIRSKMDQWRKSSYIVRQFTFQTFLEGLLAIYFFLGIIYGIQIEDYGLMFFHVFLAFGFSTVFLYTVLPIGHAGSN